MITGEKIEEKVPQAETLPHDPQIFDLIGGLEAIADIDANPPTSSKIEDNPGSIFINERTRKISLIYGFSYVFCFTNLM